MLAIEDIFTEISSLKPLDKLRLIEKILNSLNQPDKSIEKIWANEAEERIKAYENGLISTVNEEEVFKKYKRN